MMFSRKELNLVYIGTVILFLLAMVSYTAFPNQAPKRPLRIAFQSVAGKVIFDHGGHHSEAGYGLACGECHHTLAPHEYDQAGSCIECHALESDDEDMPNRADAFHQQCIACHQEYGAGPIDCSECHVMQ
jgi:hypothetical protein